MVKQKHSCWRQHHKYAIFLPLFNVDMPHTTAAKMPPLPPDSVDNHRKKNITAPDLQYKL